MAGLTYISCFASFSDDFAEEDWKDICEVDWLNDCEAIEAGGSEMHMSEELFFSSMWELADLWTEGVEVEEYLDFLNYVMFVRYINLMLCITYALTISEYLMHREAIQDACSRAPILEKKLGGRQSEFTIGQAPEFRKRNKVYLKMQGKLTRDGLFLNHKRFVVIVESYFVVA